MNKTRWLMAMVMSAGVVAMAETPVAAPAPAAPPAPKADAPAGGQEMMRERMRRMMMGGDSEGVLLRMLSNDSRLVQELGLSDAQVKEIKDALSSGEQELKELRTKLDQASMRQVELLKADTLDEDALMKAVTETGELRTQIAKYTIKQVIAAHKILTPDQRAKLRETMQKRMDEVRDRWAQGGGRQPGAGGNGERRRQRGEGAGAQPPAPPAAPAK